MSTPVAKLVLARIRMEARVLFRETGRILKEAIHVDCAGIVGADLRMQTRRCRSCRAHALNRVHRTPWARCIFSGIHLCHGCGQYDYELRFSPSLLYWVRHCWKAARRQTRAVSNLARPRADPLSERQSL